MIAEDGASDIKNYPVQYVNGEVWVNNHAHVLGGKQLILNNKFFMNAFKKINIASYLVGGSRAKLNADTLMKLDMQIPSYAEQKKLGLLFEHLDNIITLHQRKLPFFVNLT